MTRRDRNHRDDQDTQRGQSRRYEEERGSMRDQGRVEYYDDQEREHQGQRESERSGQGQRGRWGQEQSGMNDYGRGYGGDMGDMDRRDMGRRGGMRQDQMDQGRMGQGRRWGGQGGQGWNRGMDQGDRGQGGEQWAQQNWSDQRGQQGGGQGWNEREMGYGGQGWNEREMGQRWNESWNSGPGQNDMGMDEYGRGFGGRQGDYNRSTGRMGQGGMSGPHTGRGPKGYQRADERIREDVCEALTQHGQIDASDVEIEVKGGEVTLNGTVDSRQTKRMAEDAIEHLSGVREIHNHLRVGQQGMQQGQTGTQQGQTGTQQSQQTGTQGQQRAVGESERGS